VFRNGGDHLRNAAQGEGAARFGGGEELKATQTHSKTISHQLGQPKIEINVNVTLSRSEKAALALLVLSVFQGSKGL